MITADEAFIKSCAAFQSLIQSEVEKAEKAIERAAADGYAHLYHIVHKEVVGHVSDLLVQEGFKTRAARWSEELYITWHADDDRKPPGVWARFKAFLNNGLPKARLKA